MVDTGTQRSLSAKAVRSNDTLVDIEIFIGKRSFFILGPGGVAREKKILDPFFGQLVLLDKENSADFFRTQRHIPVLLGSGAGFALQELVTVLERRYGQDFCLIVVDKEDCIRTLHQLETRLAKYKNLVWITDRSQAEDELSFAQKKFKWLPLCPIQHPAYLRIDRDFYVSLARICQQSARVNFIEKIQLPRFTTPSPRILLLASQYFLMGDIIAACNELHVSYHLLTVPDGEFGQQEFIENLFMAVASFKPDFILTLNHMGIDREGILVQLLEQLQLPLASWFVDNPHLIMSIYRNLVNDWTALFTWDQDNVAPLRAMGFQQVHYLPLGTDSNRFKPREFGGKQKQRLHKWRADVSFVGNSMVMKVKSKLQGANLPEALLANYQEIGREFAESSESSVRRFFQNYYPEENRVFEALDDQFDQLAYKSLLTWEATLQYRFAHVRALLPFSPLLVGDAGWHDLLPEDGSWRYHREISYYDDLPLFYLFSKINFNCTSRQMKGAVNQRVFDVPAAGAFLLTDYQKQVEDLFELDKEIICYHSPEDAAEKVAFYLKHPQEREKIARAAHQRVIAEHSYTWRLKKMIALMKAAYS